MKGDVFQLLDGSISLDLCDIAIERNRGIAACIEIIGNFDGGDFRFYEDDQAIEDFRWFVLNSYDGRRPPGWIAEIHDLTDNSQI
jgi:hypothetical protein